MRRLGVAFSGALVAIALTAGPMAACGGLIGPNGAVNLVRTTTFAAYVDGTEHYVTSFEFAGGGGRFGSITPLPGIPSTVEKGGDWTLQRLLLETSPVVFQAAAGTDRARASAEELLKVRIDALDLTVLRGGADEIGQWAKEHDFRLPPDAPEVLDFYASRSPIFLAAAFDADAAAARGQAIGDGTPIHLTIPTDDPWVPLRILALGKAAEERVSAEVFLLTDRRPNLLPTPIGRNGIAVTHSQPATTSLLDDLRSDRGMSWVPDAGWLTQVTVDASADQLQYDLAIAADGGQPSRVDAGFELPGVTTPPDGGRAAAALLLVVLGVAGVVAIARVGGPARGRARAA